VLCFIVAIEEQKAACFSQNLGILKMFLHCYLGWGSCCWIWSLFQLLQSPVWNTLYKGKSWVSLHCYKSWCSHPSYRCSGMGRFSSPLRHKFMFHHIDFYSYSGYVGCDAWCIENKICTDLQYSAWYQFQMRNVVLEDLYTLGLLKSWISVKWVN
jgi:hypothetical protein